MSGPVCGAAVFCHLRLVQLWSGGGKLLRRMGRILLLTQKHPTVPEGWLRRASAWFGPLSTCVYIVHLIVLEGWQRWAAPHMGPAEGWIRPIAVAAISLAVGTVWLRIKTTVQKIRK